MTEPDSVVIPSGDPSVHDYVTTLSFLKDGSLHLITEHLHKDRVQVTWIERLDLPKFLESLGLTLNETSTEEGRRRVLRQITTRLKSKKEFKSWLNKHTIRSRYGSWSERDWD